VPTSGQAAVAQKAAEVEQGTLRHQVLLVAQKFKSSWVELGALLVKVRNANLWEEWGYKSFEDYCGKELRIKRQTALKLTNSYAFLARHEQELIEPERHGRSPQQEKIKEPPAFEVVSVLADAAGRGQLSDKEYQSLRESIWDDERPAPAVARDLAQRFPAPAKPAPPADLVVRRLAVLARKLASELKGCKRVPAAVADRAAALAEDVEELAAQEKG
jgi:hypothetical protein